MRTDSTTTQPARRSRRTVRRALLAATVVALALVASVGSTTPTATPTATADATGRCDTADRTAMVAAVTGQLAAITARDWRTALSFTTATFRATVDAAAFERIILDGFPVVADAVDADAGSCRSGRGDAASLVVTVEDGDGVRQDLVYRFELEQRRWRIAGAAPTVRDEGDDTMTV